MIKRELFYYAICDGCGEFCPDDEEYIIRENKVDIIDELINAEWRKKGCEWFCPKCQEKGKNE